MGVYTHTPYISERNREDTKRDTDTLILPLKAIELLLRVVRHTCMDPEKIQETEEKKQNYGILLFYF
jgi:hypothetical protein